MASDVQLSSCRLRRPHRKAQMLPRSPLKGPTRPCVRHNLSFLLLHPATHRRPYQAHELHLPHGASVFCPAIGHARNHRLPSPPRPLVAPDRKPPRQLARHSNTGTAAGLVPTDHHFTRKEATWRRIYQNEARAVLNWAHATPNRLHRDQINKPRPGHELVEMGMTNLSKQRSRDLKEMSRDNGRERSKDGGGNGNGFRQQRWSSQGRRQWWG
ncbi:hypothetical protein EUGRSUZ_B03158 [Eucalyptus grandis]|uniref:Uncharacterized protein n=2 Tax=Eucalyptus grandis TaxID=71139 RepID=A0A059D7Q9_EUCGR|nr:hypothetical protein EUGRSUZ_B03158 [Eucalyptus grandis]